MPLVYTTHALDPNTTASSLINPSPTSISIVTTPPLQTTTSLPKSDPPSLTIAFGILGVLLAFVAIVIAALQLRHMHRRKKLLLSVSELHTLSQLPVTPSTSVGDSHDSGPGQEAASERPQKCWVGPERRCSSITYARTMLGAER